MFLPPRHDGRRRLGQIAGAAREAKELLADPLDSAADLFLGGSKRNCDVARSALPRHLEFGAMVGRRDIHRSS